MFVSIQIIDTPYLVHPEKKNFLPGMLFQNPNIDLTLGSMYRYIKVVLIIVVVFLSVM